MLRELLASVEGLAGRLRTRGSVNVNDAETKGAAIALATRYFGAVRVSLTTALGQDQRIVDLDALWQDLVRLAQKNSKRKSYRRLMKAIGSLLRELNVQALVRTGGEERGERLSDLSHDETAVLATLEELLPTAAASYRQGLLDLQDGRRVSFRGTASEFREALRETLDHLAQDADVKRQTGFKLEDGQDRPTMKQKTRFVLLSRGRSKTQAAVAEKSIRVVEELAGEVLRAVYDRASLATHLETTRAEVVRIKRYVDTILFELLEISDRG